MSLAQTQGRIGPWKGGRLWREILPVAAAGLLLLSLLFPYWQVTLFAPQYPGGLRAYVYLTHVAGDDQEISNLNHYVGMRALDAAAPLERRLALPLILLSVIALLVSAYAHPAGARWLRNSAARALLRLPAVLLPVGVIADLAFWLWWFGHSLDPAAPIRIDPFTPTILGPGKVMQFATSATFGVGFYLGLAAAILAVYDYFRARTTA